MKSSTPPWMTMRLRMRKDMRMRKDNGDEDDLKAVKSSDVEMVARPRAVG